MTSTTDGLHLGERARVEAVLPREFLEWQTEARLSLFRTISSGWPSMVTAMPAHLAVIGTSGTDGAVNLATKGVGLVPRPDRLGSFTSSFRSTIEVCQSREWKTTLEERARVLLSLYSDADNFDETRLGGLEIFEGVTYANLRDNPRAVLLFSGEAPSFPSYQIDSAVEIVERGDPYYEFLLSARELFASDCFHVPQTDYPHGFVFHVRGVRDKRPFPRRGAHV